MGGAPGGPEHSLGAPLAITVVGPPPLLRLEGELDLSNIERLAAAVRAEAVGASPVVSLDMEGLTFIDSSGLHTLIREQSALRDRGGDLVVVGASARVRRVMELVGLWERFALGANR